MSWHEVHVHGMPLTGSNAPMTMATWQTRLQKQRVVWMATVRPDGRPHLVPVWFVWAEPQLYVCIAPGSVKGRNLEKNQKVCLALEDGVHPVICEGEARIVQKPWPAAVIELFQRKYEWNISTDTQYTQLVEIVPRKWLKW